MPAEPLRTKLAALVEEMASSPILALHGYAHAIAALLAESGPRCQIHPGCEQDCPKNCNCCTRKCEPGCAHCAQQEARAKLPLGHEFVFCPRHVQRNGYCPSAPDTLQCHYPNCGQPRSAHEPK